MDEVKRETLYGCDITLYPTSDIRINSISFKGYDDVKQVSFADFFYKYFNIGDGWFMLYDDEVHHECPFPIISVFSNDISDLPYLVDSITVEHTPFESDGSKQEIFSYQKIFGNPSDIVTGELVSGHYVSKAEMHQSAKIETIRIRYDDGLYHLQMNTHSPEFIKCQLLNFFTIPRDKLIVEAYPNSDLAKVYSICSVRAAIIAVKCAKKYKSDVIFQYRPFFNSGSVVIDRKTYINKSENEQGEKVVEIDGEYITIHIDVGYSTIFKHEILMNMLTACIPVYPVKYMCFDYIMTGDESIYNTDVGEVYYNKMTSLTMAHLNKISENIGGNYPIQIFSSKRNIMSKFLNVDIANNFEDAVKEILKESSYFMKEKIYRMSDKTTTHVSTARRLFRKMLVSECISKEGVSHGINIPYIEEIYKVVDGQSLFNVSGPSFFIVEYNPTYKHIVKLYTVLCYPDDKMADDEISRMKGALLCACSDYGVNFVKNFTESDLIIKLVKQKNGFDSLEAIRSFARFLKDFLDNES